MRSMPLALIAPALLMLALSDYSLAQTIRLGPGGVEIEAPERRPPPPPPPRDELRARMFELREACEDGDKRACVRLGIIIGEHRERREAWRREHPELFFFER